MPNANPFKEYKRLLLRRGIKATINSSYLEEGEPVFYTDTGELAIKKSDGTMSVLVTSAQLAAAVASIGEDIDNIVAGVDGWEYTEDNEIQLLSGDTPVGDPIPVGGGGVPFNGGYVNDENKLVFTQDGEAVDGIEPIPIPAGGGGGGSSGSRITFSLTSPKSQAVADTATVANVSFSFASVDTTSGDDTGDATLDIYVGNVIKRSMTIHQGTTTVNVMEFLALGDNTVKLKITDAYEATASRTCTIRRESLTLSWNLENTMVNSDTLIVQLTPVGSASKDVVVKVDGVIYSTDTITTSGRRFTKNITGLSTGGHLIEAYASMTVNGIELRSQTLKCAVVQNSGIAALFPDAAEQYTPFTVPFRVVDSENPADILLKVNDVVYDSRSVDRTEQEWSYRPKTAGSLKLEIVCGQVSVMKMITVSGSANVEEITDGLDVKVDPSAINDLATFNNNGYTFTLSENFDLVNGGLQNDSDGNRCIRITAGDRLTLNYPLFAGDATLHGKECKIIYKIMDSSSKTAEAISCMKNGIGFRALANNVYLSGNQTTISMGVCEDEKTELDLTIQNKAAGDRLMSIYEQCSTFSLDQYAANESFSHGSGAEGIVFGSDDADVVLYLFRAYSRDLTDDELKANYIFDGATGAEIVARQERNAIYASGKLNIEEMTRLNPDVHFLIMEAERTSHGKKDYVYGKLRHILAGGSDYHNWTADMRDAVQGTSSVEHEPFAGANQNFVLSNIECVDGTELENGYAMNGVANSVPTFQFTFKKNVTAQDQIINKSAAEWYNRFQPSIRAARENDPRIRDCMESVMCVVLYKNTGNTAVQVGPDIVEPGETIFYGLGNLCSNKDAVESFEYDDIVIEVKNNTEPQVLFKSNDLSGDNFDDNFEFRYLNEDEYTEAQAKALWQEAVDFVYETDWTEATDEPLAQTVDIGGVPYTTDSAAYRKARWKAEAADHFDMNSLYWHHNITLFLLLRDNRAKNMFWSLNSDGKWGLWFNWDNDTGLCRNNEGYVDIEPGYLDFDTIGTSDVFNGASNALFTNLRECNFAELKANYLNRESAGAWDMDAFLNYCYTNQEKICESLWLEDMQHNALRVMQNLGTTAYLKRGTGRLRLHLKKALLFQKALVDSYYCSTASESDSASFRGYIPQEWAGVAPSSVFTIKPYTDMFINLHAGSKDYYVRAYAGQPVSIDISASLNDTEIFLRNAGWIQEIGDMSGMYLGSFDASRLKRVKKLLIGSEVSGYYNTNFTTASFDNCKKVEEICLGGLVNAKKPFDFSPNIYLKKLYTRGSGVTGVVFARAGRVESVKLNAVKSITARDLNFLEEFTIVSSAELTDVDIINCPTIDTYNLLRTASAITRLRVLGIIWSNLTSAGYDILIRLYAAAGITDGADSEHANISGEVSFTAIAQRKFVELGQKYPNIDFSTGEYATEYTVTFLNYDGTVLNTQSVEFGDAALDPVQAELISTPVKPYSEYKQYVFAGWNKEFNYITQNLTVTAVFTEQDRKCTVRWWSDSTETNLLQTDVLDVHDYCSFEGTPLTDKDGLYYLGWDKQPDDVTEDMDIHAIYTAPTFPSSIPANYDYLYSDDPNDNSAYTREEFFTIVNSRRYNSIIDPAASNAKIKICLPAAAWSTIGDEPIILKAYGNDHYRLADDPTAFGSTVWGMVGARWSKKMHDTNTNAGGWNPTDVRDFLNNTIYPYLPDHWKKLIETVQVISTRGESLTTTVIAEDKIFAFAYTEVGLGSGSPYGSEVDPDAQCKVFPVFTDNPSRIRKEHNGAGNAVNWWLRSPWAGSSTNFANVYNLGSYISIGASSALSLSFGFCLGSKRFN